MYMEGLKSKTFRRKPMLTYDGYYYSSSGGLLFITAYNDNDNDNDNYYKDDL